MKTLQELHSLGIRSLSLKSSITRKFITKSELDEFKKDTISVNLFNLSHSKKHEIINCLETGRDFWFQGEKIDIIPLSFLISKDV